MVKHSGGIHLSKANERKGKERNANGGFASKSFSKISDVYALMRRNLKLQDFHVSEIRTMEEARAAYDAVIQIRKHLAMDCNCERF